MAGKPSTWSFGHSVAAVALFLQARTAERNQLPVEAFLSGRAATGKPVPSPLRPGRARHTRPASLEQTSSLQKVDSIGAGAALAPAVLLATSALVAASSRRRSCHRSSACTSAVARKATATKTVEEWGYSKEVAALEKAAAQLRADALHLEAEMEEKRREEQAKWFNFFDADGSGAVDVAELRRGMKELSGIDLDDSMAERLLKAHDDNKDGVLQLEEFDTKQLEMTWEKLRAEDYDRELAAWQEDRRKQREAEAREEYFQARVAYESTLPLPNEDTGFLTRIGSVLVYFLPLMDSLKFAAPLAAASPMLRLIIEPLLGPFLILKAIPFSQLLSFIALQTLADVRELPLLLRFNMRQAVTLDIIIGLLQLLQVAATYAIYGEAPTDLVSQWDSNGLVFLVILGCVTYSSVLSLMGFTPNNIPYISPYAERYMAPTRKAVRMEDLEKEAEAPEDKPPSSSSSSR